ncbi:MAG: hypothetical protein ACR2HN_10885 [Tepidiformaceae bacterium]
MADSEYQNVEAWHTSVRLAAAVGRLKVNSVIKASAEAHAHAFEQAGMACALIAEGSGREGPSQVGLYRDARGALAQCRAWLHVLAAVTNESDALFGNELELAEQATRQLGAMLRTIDRGPGAAGPRPPLRAPGAPAPRPPGPPRGGQR